jgi:hypothetical protein
MLSEVHSFLTWDFFRILKQEVLGRNNRLFSFHSKTFLCMRRQVNKIMLWTYIFHRYIFQRRSQWPRGLRHEPSTPARTLGSWVRIPLKAWMSVCFYSVFMLFCVQVAALRRAYPPSKESYRLCIGLRNWKSGQGPKGCRAIDREILKWIQFKSTSVFSTVIRYSVLVYIKGNL